MAGGGGARERGGIAGEFAEILRLASVFGTAAPRVRGVTLGIGDDAAVLRPRPGASSCGPSTRRSRGSTSDGSGCRSRTSAGARSWRRRAIWPRWGPSRGARFRRSRSRTTSRTGLDALSQGQADAARAVGCPIVGGNLSRGGELSVTTTLLGTATRAVRRSGARQGDGVWLAGGSGSRRRASRALRADDRGRDARCGHRGVPSAVACAGKGRALWRVAHAAIDVSDGLAQDAGAPRDRKQVAIVLDEALPAAHAGDALAARAALGTSWLDLVLTAARTTRSSRRRGSRSRALRAWAIVRGAGVWLRTGGDRATRSSRGGFDHFRPSRSHSLSRRRAPCAPSASSAPGRTRARCPPRRPGGRRCRTARRSRSHVGLGGGAQVLGLVAEALQHCLDARGRWCSSAVVRVRGFAGPLGSRAASPASSSGLISTDARVRGGRRGGGEVDRRGRRLLLAAAAAGEGEEGDARHGEQRERETGRLEGASLVLHREA